ncbi:MAG: MBL fold metallo-hydrolase [Spirochaetes bacterium]|nr:MBL fold metallo-hydrolase [Spirochaetota bacterium]MBU0954270.1 MBL fold metallo-hydrolase [Spirochaetota bacterium]
MSHIKRKIGPNSGLGALGLTTDGATELTFIGCGSAFSKKYYQNNLLVAQGDDHVLIDCGSRAPEALALLGLSVMDIHNYLITHSHADHIGGLEEVMLVNRYVARKKPNLIVTEPYARLLWDKSLKGGCAYSERHDGKWLELADFWNLLHPAPLSGSQREHSSIKIGNIKLDLFRTMHIPDNARSWRESALSYGVVINDRIAFSSDTRFDPGLFTFWQKNYNLDIIFHDCQMFTGGVHSSIDELATLPAETKAKIHLMHYGDAALALPDKASAAGFAGFVEQWHTYVFA